MALIFKTVTVNIPHTTGVFRQNEKVSFGRRVRAADVAVKAFKLAHVGGTDSSDIVHVGAHLQNIGEEAVEFSVSANYSDSRYTGEISVLIIADLAE